jgi:hypothetical protein
MFRRAILLVVCAYLFPTVSPAQTKCPPQFEECRNLTPEQLKEMQEQRREAQRPLDNEWYRGNRITVRQSVGGSHVDVTFEIFDRGSVLIGTGDERQTGKLLMIDGYWLLAKDLTLPKGQEIDYLDRAVLAVRLSLRLLSKVAPDGPAKIDKQQKISIQEKKRLAVATPSAEVDINPPWSLDATIKPTGPHQCSFNLEVKAPYGWRFDGTWQKDDVQPVLPDDTSLSGWQVYHLGEIPIEQDGHKMVDYGAIPSDLRPATVAELRRAEKK